MYVYLSLSVYIYIYIYRVITGPRGRSQAAGRASPRFSSVNMCGVANLCYVKQHIVFLFVFLFVFSFCYVKQHIFHSAHVFCPCPWSADHRGPRGDGEAELHLGGFQGSATRGKIRKCGLTAFFFLINIFFKLTFTMDHNYCYYYYNT